MKNLARLFIFLSGSLLTRKELDIVEDVLLENTSYILNTFTFILYVSIF